MKILLLEPYYTGSHAEWADGYARHSHHQVELLTLPGRFWKWRMHGGAVTLARQFLALPTKPDLILATDMVDLTSFLALTRPHTAHIPVALYFHENQLTYPWSPTDRDVAQQRDKHYGFINYTSALSADMVLFNSGYNRDSFLSALPNLLKHFPDFNELPSVQQIADKSQVLSLGLDLARFDGGGVLDEDSGRMETLPPSVPPARGEASSPSPWEGVRGRADSANPTPLILWAHRWEHDKNPADFFRALTILSERGLSFELAVLGENFSQQPKVFLQSQTRLAKHIVQFGYADSFADYARWLWRADILPVTSNQDFFGGTVVEAIYCNCFPLLPHRLAYPYLIPAKYQPDCFYHDFDELVSRLEQAIINIEQTRQFSLREVVAQYDWQIQAEGYDQLFAELAGRL
ncbi:DUF3524 domain-containing protein [Anaerolineales bacterium HSG6]|nr:DUF3524 domain-containing protein [Anaerolineales bacterium HSG6]